MNKILEIENFRLSFQGPFDKATAVRGVDLAVSPGETLALVGESGCGKTALCRAILMLHSQHAEIESGRILLCGRDVTLMTEKELEAVRGKDGAMIFQDPMSSLNPVFSIGKQIMEPILRHQKVSRGEAKQRALELLQQVGIPEPEIRFSQYPHHFSGGMRQRVAIAIALACSPKLLIADEPTTSLDVKTQEQILELLQNVCKDRERGVVFVTHDLGIAGKISDRTAVMKDGIIVEIGKTSEIFENPRHEYTKELMRYARYGKGDSHFHGRYTVTAGKIPEKAETECEQKIRKSGITNGAFRQSSGNAFDKAAEKETAILAVTVSNLTKTFPLGKKKVQKVLDNFSLTVEKGEIVGIVGPSGCGKSTLARCLAGIYTPDGGTIEFADGIKRQMIFQDSASAFNPRMTLVQIIAEPLVIANRKQGRKWGKKAGASAERSLKQKMERKLTEAEIREKALSVMAQAELPEELAERHPYDVSGGQRQRAAIARALITEPDFIIADEPISSLDVSTQAQIIHLLKKIRDERDLTMLLIAHDLPMAAHISDRIVEMEKK